MKNVFKKKIYLTFTENNTLKQFSGITTYSR